MNRPEQKFRAGPIEASIWKNEKEKDGVVREYRSVTFQRRFKDKDGKWKSSNTLQVYDLPRALIVLGKAYESLILTQSEKEEGMDDPEASDGVAEAKSQVAQGIPQAARPIAKVA